MAENDRIKVRLTVGGIDIHYAGQPQHLNSTVLAAAKELRALQPSYSVSDGVALLADTAQSSFTVREIDELASEIKGALDSLAELSEEESLRLQMAMDRLSKLMSVLSNLLKKISATAETITQNLK